MIQSKRFSIGSLATAAILLLFASEGQAQTHPCDQAAPNAATIQSGAPYKIQFCQPQGDRIESVTVTVDGQVVADRAAVSSIGLPNAQGLLLYETGGILQVARGQHALQLVAFSRSLFTGQLIGGATAGPFGFAAVDETAPPAAPAFKALTR